VPAIRSRRDFDRIGSNGRTRSGPLMVVRFVPNGRDHDRVGISTSRRLGSAVVRNGVRRRIREIVRRCDVLLRPPGRPSTGRDILIVARPASVEASFADLQAALVAMLRAIPGASPDPTS
jgi:ribonuclease P protein component